MQTLSDEENPEWTAEDFSQSMAFADLPVTLQARLRGRPRKPDAKLAVKLRLDPDVLAALRATGPGWQTRVNQVLREWVEHLPAQS